jgi:hypothetical protein
LTHQVVLSKVPIPNSGWGINGTGPEYNDATEALKKYLPLKASFEVMVKQMRNKTVPPLF